MAREEKTYTVTAEGMKKSEAIDAAREELLESGQIEGDLRKRPVPGSVNEIQAPQKQKVAYEASENDTAFYRVYTLKGEGVEEILNEMELEEKVTPAQARARAKELAQEHGTSIEVHVSATQEDTLMGTQEYTPGIEGKWEFDIVEVLEVDDQETEDEGAEDEILEADEADMDEQTQEEDAELLADAAAQ